jgi:hypothetical protein
MRFFGLGKCLIKDFVDVEFGIAIKIA